MARKTINVSKILEMLNNVLASDDFINRDKEIVSAIAESILEITGNTFKFEKISDEEYSRKYIIEEEK